MVAEALPSELDGSNRGRTHECQLKSGPLSDNIRLIKLIHVVLTWRSHRIVGLVVRPNEHWVFESCATSCHVLPTTSDAPLFSHSPLKINCPRDNLISSIHSSSRNNLFLFSSKRAPEKPLSAPICLVLKFTLPNEIISKVRSFLKKSILNPNDIQFSVLVRRSKNNNLSYSEVAEGLKQYTKYSVPKNGGASRQRKRNRRILMAKWKEGLPRYG